MSSYFPTAQARADLAYRGSYLAALPDIDLSSNPILRTAVDTLCFAHVGSKNNDDRLIRQSQTSYGRVLNLLIQATNRSDGNAPHMEPKAIVTSIMLLCLYDDAIPVPFQGRNGWAAHYWGSLELLRVHGPSFLNMKQPFDRLIFFNLRMPCFFLGLARRKAILLGEDEWLALSASISDSSSRLTSFYAAGMKISALLERTDRLIESRHKSYPRQQRDLSSLCNSILQIRTALVSWFRARCATPESAAKEVPSTFSVTDSDRFDMETEEHCFMSSSGTFPHLFHFAIAGCAPQNHTLLTLTCLILDCTLLRLLHFLPSTAAHLPQSEDHVLLSAHHLASDLCRSVHYYASTDSLAYADFTDFLLEMAQNFFEEFGVRAGRELGWVQAVRCATGLRRKRIVSSSVQRKTLCRMGDCAPGVARATRWRARRVGEEFG